MSDEIERRLRDAIGAQAPVPVDEAGSLEAIRARAVVGRRRRRVGGAALAVAAALLVGVAIGAGAGRDQPTEVVAAGEGDATTTVPPCESFATTVPATETTTPVDGGTQTTYVDGPTTTIGLSQEQIDALEEHGTRVSTTTAPVAPVHTATVILEAEENGAVTTVPPEGAVEGPVVEIDDEGATHAACVAEDDETSATETTTGPRTPSSSAPTTGTSVPAPDQAAIDAITNAFVRAFDASTTVEERFALVEDGGAIAAAGEEAAAKFPEAAATITAQVHLVTLTGPDTADVRFELFYDQAAPLGVQEGTAVRVDGVWKVSRATRCAVIQQAGVTCPAP